MRNARKYVKPRKIEGEAIAGHYVARTSSGRTIHCFARSPQEAANNMMTGLTPREYILSISRD